MSEHGRWQGLKGRSSSSLLQNAAKDIRTLSNTYLFPHIKPLFSECSVSNLLELQGNKPQTHKALLMRLNAKCDCLVTITILYLVI